jgi:two-component system, OmpR family, response regulator ArlR
MARALLVEDDAIIRYLVTTLLRPLHYEIATAENGTDALYLLSQDPHFDLVVTDVLLPKVDGLLLIETLKQTFPQVPILAISACADRLEDARAKGADCSLNKPFSQQQFVAAVERMTSRMPT